MRLYLFGGAEISLGQFQPQLDLIEEAIININPRQVLHIPFARIKCKESEEEYWGDGWYFKMKKLINIEYLDASKEDDIKKADKPLVFVSGGSDRENLINQIKNNLALRDIIRSSDFYIGESSGSMISGELVRKDGSNKELVSGLGLLKNTVIEPHYTERNWQELLKNDLKQSNLKYGLGIDCATAAVIDTKEYPDNIKKIGQGEIELLTN